MNKTSWVGIHKCGGLIEAIPNQGDEQYRCSVHNCSNHLEEDNYYLFKSDELPNSITPMVVKSMSREYRKQIAECETRSEAKNQIQKIVNSGEVSVF